MHIPYTLNRTIHLQKKDGKKHVHQTEAQNQVRDSYCIVQ